MRISDWSSDVCSSDLDLVAAELAQLLGAELRHIAALVADLAADDGAVVAEIAHDRHGDGRLAAAPLADHADPPAPAQGPVDADPLPGLAGAREVGATDDPALQLRPPVAFSRSRPAVLPPPPTPP